jgi:hypothetical protein
VNAVFAIVAATLLPSSLPFLPSLWKIGRKIVRKVHEKIDRKVNRKVSSKINRKVVMQRSVEVGR